MSSQLEIKDIIHLHIQFLRNGLHQQGVVLAGECGRCQCFRCGAAFCRSFFCFSFRGGRGGVELLVDETKDRLRTQALGIESQLGSETKLTWNSVSLLNLKASLIDRSRWIAANQTHQNVG